MTDTDDAETDESEEPVEFTPAVDSIDLEARQVMYEELVDEFGKGRIDAILNEQARMAAEQQVRRYVTELYDKRGQLRQQG